MTKIYGFTLEGVQEGDIQKANKEWHQKHYSNDAIASYWGWEKCFDSFADTKKALIKEMNNSCHNMDMIKRVRELKAADCPIMN